MNDFDGDGINDIAYSSNNAHTIVMFGNGDFTFRDPTDYYTQGFHLIVATSMETDHRFGSHVGLGFYFLQYEALPKHPSRSRDGTFSEMQSIANTNMHSVTRRRLTETVATIWLEWRMAQKVSPLLASLVACRISSREI